MGSELQATDKGWSKEIRSRALTIDKERDVINNVDAEGDRGMATDTIGSTGITNDTAGFATAMDGKTEYKSILVSNGSVAGSTTAS